MEKIATILRRDWPHVVIMTCLLSAAIIVAGMWMTIRRPDAGEILENGIISAMLLVLSLGAAFFSGVIMRGIWLSSVEITRDMPKEAGPLERVLLLFGIQIEPTALSEWTSPHLGADIIVCLQQGEDQADYAARAAIERGKAMPARWVAVIPFQEVGAVIYSGPDIEDAYVFSRNLPPFAAELPREQSLPDGIDFVEETADQYRKYIEWFAYHFRRWASGEKLRINGKRAGRTILEALQAKAAFSASVFMLLCLPAFAQKSQQVDRVAPGIPPEGVKVTYMFKKGDIYRTGNGRDNYTTLLKNAPAYRDYGGGLLEAIVAGKKTVYRADAVQDVAAPAAGMRTLTANPPARLGFEMPDSLEMSEMADHAKYEIWKASRAADNYSRPVWEVVMFGFWQWCWVLMLIFLSARISAWASAREGFWAFHRKAKFILFCVSLSTVVLLATNLLLLAKWAGWPTWALIIATVVLWFVSERVVAAINPDFRPAQGNNPMSGRGRYFDNNNPQLHE